MKKVIKSLLVVMLCILSLGINSETINAASMSISGDGTVKEGDTITVTVKVSGGPATSGSISISCSSSFEIVSGKWALSGTTLANYDASNKKGAFAFSSAKNLNGNYFTITLRAKSVDKNAKVTVSVELKNDGASVYSSSTSKTINIICKTHTFGDWTTTEATCTKAGSKKRTCSVCGTVENETIAALGHSVSDYTVTKEPTCTAAGTRSGKCTRCGETVNEAIPATGHTFGEWEVSVEATCTVPGIEIRSCKNCDEKETRESELAPHEYGTEFTVIQEPSISQPGIVEATCINCGAAFRQEIACSQTDKDNGLIVECDEGVFAPGTELEISAITPEEGDVNYSELEKISGQYKIIDLEAKNGSGNVEPDGKINVSFDIPEDFSNNIAIGKIGEDGSVEILGTTVMIDEESRTANAQLSSMGKYVIIDMEAVPQAKAGLPSYWKYAAFGEGGVIALLFLLLILGKRKKDDDKAEEEKPADLAEE